MVMFCSDVFPKGVDTPQFCFPRHRNAKPCVFQIGIKIQRIRSLGKEQELMLRIFTDLYKYLISPFRLPSGEIAHAGKKKVLRTFLFHHLKLTRKEFRVSEVINHMPAFHVVAGIAICTPHCAANDDIHVLYAHWGQAPMSSTQRQLKISYQKDDITKAAENLNTSEKSLKKAHFNRAPLRNSFSGIDFEQN